MAKACNISYGSSPNDSYFNDWIMNDLYNTEGLLPTDQEELFGESSNYWPSISNDIGKIDSDSIGNSLFSDLFDCNPLMKSDCMWSGNTTALSTSASSTTTSDSVNGGVTTAVPFAAVTDSKKHIVLIDSQEMENETTKATSQQSAAAAVVDSKSAVKGVKSEPIDDDYEVALQRHRIANNQKQQEQPTATSRYIPPGTSLLRKSNTQQQLKKQQQQPLIQISTEQFLRERDQLVTQNSQVKDESNYSHIYARPDTPPDSLEDDDDEDDDNENGNESTEFKHNVDLTACVMGSNNISLTNIDPAMIINRVCQELQDTSKNQIDMRFVNSDSAANSLTEVLDVIVKDKCSSRSYDSNPTSPEGGDAHQMDSDSDDDFMTESLKSKSTTAAYRGNSSSSSSHQYYHHQPSYLHSDHSYTRCKDGMDDLSTNLETPSDSDEEIDVVSIGDKKLPTNPSDRDRRALQTKVAYKFSNARIVKTANGVRTIPPCRRVSYDLPYTPASNSPVKSVSSTRYPSPSSTPYHQYNNQSSATKHAQQQMLASMLSDGTTATAAAIPFNAIAGDKSRKRINAAVINTITGSECISPVKKQRGKKSNGVAGTKGAGSPIGSTSSSSGIGIGNGSGIVTLKRQNSFDESSDTIEKRNLHNDMERQRRIGLKNLFESLKKQIPSIKDKERAPKVNILREAAKLCTALTIEDRQLSEQKAILKEELKRRQNTLAKLLASRNMS